MFHWHPVGVAVLLSLKTTQESCLNIIKVKCAHGRSRDRVVGRLKDRVDHAAALLGADDLGGGLELVKVERIVAGNRTVEAGLDERRPPIVELVRSTLVILADTGHARVDGRATVHCLDGGFAEEKVHKLLVLEGADKVRLVQLAQVVLLRALGFPVDQRVSAGKVRHSARVELTICARENRAGKGESE